MIYTDYYELCNYVRENGTAAVPSRFGTTTEVIGEVAYRFNAGDLPTRPRMSLQVCWCELVQFIAGQFDPLLFKNLSPNAQQSLFTREMAYGPRIWEFVPRVIEELNTNPRTREAVLYLGRAYQTCTPSEPCTNLLQFFVRERKLITTASMRSLDLIKGLPPDMAMFGGLAQCIAACLGIEATTVTIHATGSAHIYYNDILAEKMPVKNQPKRHFYMPNFLTLDEQPPLVIWQQCVDWATQLMHTLWKGVPSGITYVHND